MELRDALTFRIAAAVVDIRPNGNLVIEARREIRINEEVWMQSLTGVIDRKSIGPTAPCAATKSTSCGLKSASAASSTTATLAAGSVAGTTSGSRFSVQFRTASPRAPHPGEGPGEGF